MNKHLPKKAKDIKGPVAIAELRRAHYIIVILSLSFAMILGFISLYSVQIDALLGAIAIALLLVVAIVSLATAVALRRR